MIDFGHGLIGEVPKSTLRVRGVVGSYATGLTEAQSIVLLCASLGICLEADKVRRTPKWADYSFNVWAYGEAVYDMLSEHYTDDQLIEAGNVAAEALTDALPKPPTTEDIEKALDPTEGAEGTTTS